MFQFPRFPSPPLWIQGGDAAPSRRGFSHSGTPGSKAVCASPGTIAACRALRRLPAPRHPPCARVIFPRHARATVSNDKFMNSIGAIYDIDTIGVAICRPFGPVVKMLPENELDRSRSKSDASYGDRDRLRAPARRRRAMRLSRYAGSRPGGRRPRWSGAREAGPGGTAAPG